MTRPDHDLGGLFPGDSEMACRMRALDWSQTGLGPPERWPESLKVAASICVTSRFPMVIFWGPALDQLYNDAYIPVLGRTKHPQWLGRSGRECWREIWPTIGPMLEGVLATGEATWSEDLYLLINRNVPSEESYFTFSYSPMLEAGRVAGIFCAVTETTDRVLSERRLQTLRDLGERVLDAKSDVEACRLGAEALSRNPHDIPFSLFYLLDEDRQTARLAAAHGLEPGDAMSPTIVRLGPGEVSAWPLGAVATSWESRLVQGLSVRLRGDGAEPIEQAVLCPIPGTSPATTVGVVVAGVSPRRVLDEDYRSFFGLVAGQAATAISNARAYAEERKRAEALAELDRAKTSFFSNVSHEFRTPLTLMLGPLEDALGDPDLPARDRERLTVSHRNSLRLLRLVNSLLDFSRIEAGRMEATFEDTDVCTFTTELASVFRSAFERAGLSLDVRCDPLSAPAYVDREMWEKIVLNLLSNAFKFTLAGGVAVSIRERDGHLECAVQDTGCGIPPAELPHVCERFHRVRGSKGRTHEGTGIGLALVHELVKLHGGTLRVESSVDVGTTFTIRLPLGSAHLAKERIGAPRTLASTALGAARFLDEALGWIPEDVVAEGASASDHVTTGGARVLLADDNRDMRDYLRRLLAVHWRVVAVGDGEAALRVARADPPDLVLSDVMMPGLDGFGLLKALREHPATRTVPVVLLSARAGEEARIEGLGAGADDYLTKPFSARELVARVNAHVEMARIRKDAAREREQLLARETVARREAELQKEHLAALFTQAPAPICVLRGPAHVVELANPSMCAVWGRAADEVLGRPLFEALPELVGQGLQQLLDDVWATGASHVGKETTAVLRRQDGSRERFVFNFACALLRNVAGAPDGTLVIAFDVTDEVRAREKMDELRAQAEEANRLKDEFLAMLGHELRNPLAAVRNAVATATLDDTRRPRALEIARRQADQLGRLIDDLLDVARITRGRIMLRKERVYLDQVLQRTVESVRPVLEDRGHRLAISLPDVPVGLDADAARLEQVVVNLLTNAAKYTEPGGDVFLSVRPDGDAVEIRVRDTGIGIAAPMLPRIFDLFTQADRGLDRGQGGLGIGLTVARRLVELHGGTIHARSDGLGRGSEFTVRMPVAPAVPDEAPSAASSAVGGSRHASLLIVEDNPDAAETLVMLLELLGHRVRVVHDGVAALETARALRPDVMLVDIGLPGIDGYEVARRVRREPTLRQVTLVALTGYGRAEDHQRALAAGFDHHLVKPVDVHRLERLVESIGVVRADTTVH